jgi:23S rRNA pseudouridine2605 synthase
MRLQRALARAGIASRRQAENLIRAGKVRVNGKAATIGAKVDLEKDEIVVSGRRVRQAAVTWIALHKPVGYVVSRHDPRGRPTVYELLPDVPALTYVGRLDVMTSGLLLLTTDGGAVNRLTHPRYGVRRSYRALVHGREANEIRQELTRPVIVDGRPVRIVKADVRDRGKSVELELVLAEGRYRIVRRACARLGLRVERLVRLAHGPVRLGRLGPGKWRHLSRHEREAVKALTAA